jgi:hypothetical protein
LAKEEDGSYALPRFDEPPATVAISLDGTCTLMREDGWREAMVLASRRGGIAAAARRPPMRTYLSAKEALPWATRP